jgi:ABC-type uncharacterized transport system permease subunit
MMNLIKSLKYRLQLFDGLWSIPLAFIVFMYAGYLSASYFGDPLISIQYLQQVLMAAMILILANFVVFLGINFNFRALQRDFYSKELKYYSKMELNSWQKIKLYLLVYFGLLLAFIVILWLVMTATGTAIVFE